MTALTVHRVGTERTPVLVVDRPGEADAALRAAGLGARYGQIGSPHFPGVRAEAPRAYAEQLARGLGPALAQAMGWGDAQLTVEASYFSIVTTPPGDLTLFQRVPHTDGLDEARVAVMHYLSSEDGGTAFFRHRTTGFERVTPDRHAGYDRQLRTDLAEHGEPQGYRRGSDAVFEEIFRVSAAPGRLAVYTGSLLHSGLVPDGPLPADPARGRLTVNTFLLRRGGEGGWAPSGGPS